MGLTVERAIASGLWWRSCGVGLTVDQSCLVLTISALGCGVVNLEVFVTVGMSWWWREDGGGGRMVTVSALGLGVLMGAFVGLGFRYLGGVVVSTWGGGLSLGWVFAPISMD